MKRSFMGWTCLTPAGALTLSRPQDRSVHAHLVLMVSAGDGRLGLPSKGRLD